ncbi:Glycosyl transferase family 2 [Hyella patelloides LEGE 07179]|uniref:Glycosyl transferase family 2 n=1 Tax=Hyella patelloides LEGE 07179 TaxID=945734 RepID=A0A563VWK9_9CYAN|nr:glycosyltransferase family 2 protein [Hyella patelloides]VEP15839.1 Glycosyl transferase family 2 [Hyella patelloides LEGE 07179]
MSEILLSIIIPSYNRPQLLPLAVKSALAQTIENFEVIVVDDCSPQPVSLPEHPRLRVIRLERNQGGAAARNIGINAAKGHWITFLDDDDRLLPNMAEVSLQALQETNSLPQPVAVISGIEVVEQGDRIIQTRIPPTLAKGSHFGLEEIASSQSFFTKQTLVAEKEVLLSIGGFDESFASRIHTDLFLRLNLVCSIIGIPQVTYRLYEHQEFRVSTDPMRRQVSFNRLVAKHQAIYQAHPRMFADSIFNQAIMSYKIGQIKAAAKNLAWAMKIDPLHTIACLGSPYKKALLKIFARLNHSYRSKSNA